MPTCSNALSHFSTLSDCQQITPLLLTFNEEANLTRTLYALRWAQRVVIVDSGSNDRTEAIACSYPNVAWFHHPFKDHSSQWAFGIFETGIDTPYVFALDADMIVPAAFLEEATACFLCKSYSGAWIPFTLVIHGTSLPGSLYPPQIRLFRKDSVSVTQYGHTQVFSVSGPLYEARTRILHDDRKSFDHWLQAQIKYSTLESTRITAASSLQFKDLLRLIGLMPAITLVISYIKAGAFLRGTASASYAIERCIFELLLLGRLLRHQVTK